jgi:hypothetical protein
MSLLTAQYNEAAIESVRRQINRKNGSLPYFANIDSVKNVVTDYDHHPYTRWFRGVYYYPEPIIAEREAGWRTQKQGCYSLIVPQEKVEIPADCWQPACTTVFPCNPELDEHRNANDLMVHGRCMVQYR